MRWPTPASASELSGIDVQAAVATGRLEPAGGAPLPAHRPGRGRVIRRPEVAVAMVFLVSLTGLAIAAPVILPRDPLVFSMDELLQPPRSEEHTSELQSHS